LSFREGEFKELMQNSHLLVNPICKGFSKPELIQRCKNKGICGDIIFRIIVLKNNTEVKHKVILDLFLLTSSTFTTFGFKNWLMFI
jgi:hypothetical protein